MTTPIALPPIKPEWCGGIQTLSTKTHAIKSIISIEARQHRRNNSARRLEAPHRVSNATSCCAERGKLKSPPVRKVG